MRALASVAGGYVAFGRLEVVQVGPRGRPTLRLTAMHPTAHLPVSVDVLDVPRDPDFVVPSPDEGLDAAPLHLAPSPTHDSAHRRVISEYAAALGRWEACRKAERRRERSAFFSRHDGEPVVAGWL